MANESLPPDKVAFLSQRLKELLDSLPLNPPGRPALVKDRNAASRLADSALDRLEALGRQLWASELAARVRERIPPSENRAVLPNSAAKTATYLIRLAVDRADWEEARRVEQVGYSEEELKRLASGSVDWLARGRECLFNVFYGDQQHLDDFKITLKDTVYSLVPELAKRKKKGKRRRVPNSEHLVSLEFIDVKAEVRRVQSDIQLIILNELPRLEAHALAGDTSRFKGTLEFLLSYVWDALGFLAGRFRSKGEVAPLPEKGNPLSRPEAEYRFKQALSWIETESAQFVEEDVVPQEIAANQPLNASSKEDHENPAVKPVRRVYRACKAETAEELLKYLIEDAPFDLVVGFKYYWSRYNFENPTRRKHERDFDSAEPDECPRVLMEIYECMSRLGLPAHRSPPFNTLRFNAVSARVELTDLRRLVEKQIQQRDSAKENERDHTVTPVDQTIDAHSALPSSQVTGLIHPSGRSAIVQEVASAPNSASKIVAVSLGLEEQALALLFTHPDWSIGQIAEEIGAHRSCFYKMKKFRTAAEMQGTLKPRTLKGARPRRGTKYNGTVEAYDDSEPPD